MIYILSGNDTKSKNIFLKKVCKDDSLVFTYRDDIEKKDIIEKAGSVSLFGEVPIVVIDNLIRNKEIEFSDEELNMLSSSKSIFILMEDKLLINESKKYSKFAKIEEFNKAEIKQIGKDNIFNIADSFSRKDKIHTWILYREAISSGSSPEELSGIIFWKIKDMALKGNRFFTKDELSNLSNELTSIYHRSHSGELDFVISLEQFILSSLSK